VKNQPNFQLSTIIEKYHKLYSRLLRAISSGRLAHFSLAKKRQLLSCLCRYEKQLKNWGRNVTTCVALLLPAATIAQPIPVGSEFQINTYTTSGQATPAIACDLDGDFVVTWAGAGPGDNEGIFAQRYNSFGIAQGNQFAVNSYHLGLQYVSKVAMDDSGNFVIIWTSLGQDGQGFGIYGQRFDTNGNTLGIEFRVNTYTLADQSLPSVAMDSDGDFVVCWEGSQPGISGGNIYAKRFDNNGNEQGNEFQVNTIFTGEQTEPAVAMNSSGDFIVTWTGEVENGSPYDIYAQRFNNSGTFLGAEFNVNTVTYGNQNSPAISMNDDGDFVIAWDSNDESGYGVFVQRYNQAGNAIGSEFLVNTYTTNGQEISSVAMDNDGDFVITWFSNQEGNFGFYEGIYAQQYNSFGLPQGNEFHVNTYSTNQQAFPKVALDSEGDFVVVWHSFSPDGSDVGIFGQRFQFSSCNSQNWYSDMDNDGFGAGSAITSCDQPPNTVTNNTDCNDTDMAIHPGAIEICNNIDDNCNNSIDENVSVCPYPVEMSTTDISNTAATLHWSQQPCAKKYKIVYQKIPGNTNGKVSVPAPSGSVAIGGLMPSSHYKWFIKTKCGSGFWSEASPWQYFTTSGPGQLQTSNEPDIDVVSQGISIKANISGIKLYPNPASGNVHLVSNDETILKVVITDISGRIVWQQTDLNTLEMDINIIQLQAGLYYVHSQSAGQLFVEPLVVMD
jgi:hypothetical protein